MERRGERKRERERARERKERKKREKGIEGATGREREAKRIEKITGII